MNTEPEKKIRKKPVTHSYKTELADQKSLTLFWKIVAFALAVIVVIEMVLLIIYV